MYFGETLSHGFIVHHIFPVEFCKASFLPLLFNEVDDTALVASFLSFSPQMSVARLSFLKMQRVLIFGTLKMML